MLPPGATSLSGVNFFSRRFEECHSRLRSGSVDQQKCNSFRRKSGSFLASGPGLRKRGPAIGRSGWQCPAVPTSRARTCENAEFEGGGTEKMKENGPLCALS